MIENLKRYNIKHGYFPNGFIEEISDNGEYVKFSELEVALRSTIDNKSSVEIKFLKRTIRAYNKMVMCYRIGGKLPEWVLDHLRKAEQRYGGLSKI